MRDKNRIKTFLHIFEDIWTQYPDLRFGQIISIIESSQNQDLFYIEDDDFLRLLHEIVSNLIKKEDNIL